MAFSNDGVIGNESIIHDFAIPYIGELADIAPETTPQLAAYIRQQHANAYSLCLVCQQPIGYDCDFYQATNAAGKPAGFIHDYCKK